MEHQVYPDKFFECIYRDKFEAAILDTGKIINRKSFVVYQDRKKHRVCINVGQVIKQKKWGTYFTPSIFWHHKERTKERLVWIMCIVVDFDFCKPDREPEYWTPDDVAQRLNEITGYFPHFVWQTKTFGNYQACFIIEPMACTFTNICTHERISHAIADAAGADVAATNANNLYSIPKNTIWVYADPEKPIGIEEFSEWYECEYKPEHNNVYMGNNLISLDEHALLNHKAIRVLLNAEFTEWRNHACFTIALLFKSLGRAQEVCEDFILGDWFDKVNDRARGWTSRFSRTEALKTVKSAYQGKWQGPSAEWITQLSGIEFMYRIRRYTYERKVFMDGYKGYSELRRAVTAFLEKHHAGVQRITYAALSTATGIPQRSLERHLKDLRKDGVINYTSKRGRYNSGLENLRLQTQAEIILDLNEDIETSVEMERAVS